MHCARDGAFKKTESGFRTCRTHGMRRPIGDLIAHGPVPRQFRCAQEAPCIVHQSPRGASEAKATTSLTKKPSACVKTRVRKSTRQSERRGVQVKVRVRKCPRASERRRVLVKAKGDMPVANNCRPAIKYRIIGRRSMRRPTIR